MPRIDRAVTDVSAPPEEVYAAFVDADALAAWLPPGGMTGEIADADLRVGGGFTMTLRYDEAPAGVEFDSDDPDTAGRMTMTWTFAARDKGTRVAIDATDVPPAIDVEAHQQGLDASLANLAAWLAG